MKWLYDAVSDMVKELIIFSDEIDDGLVIACQI